MFVFYKPEASKETVGEIILDMRRILKTDMIYGVPSSVYFKIVKNHYYESIKSEFRSV